MSKRKTTKLRVAQVPRDSDRVKLAKALDVLLAEESQLEQTHGFSIKLQMAAHAECDKVVGAAYQKRDMILDREQGTRVLISNNLEVLRVKIRQAQQHMRQTYGLNSQLGECATPIGTNSKGQDIYRR